MPHVAESELSHKIVPLIYSTQKLAPLKRFVISFQITSTRLIHGL